MVTHYSTLAGKFHEQRSLMGYSPWGCKEADTSEHACTHGKLLGSKDSALQNLE